MSKESPRLRKNAVASDSRTFGVEEEYQLLDAESGRPSDSAFEIVRSLSHLAERADREYFRSQLETSTPICRTADEAFEALATFRHGLTTAAAEHGVTPIGSGMPPVGGEEEGTLTPKVRYHLLADRMRDTAARLYATGTHVHVEVPSKDAGVRVLRRLARWAPALMAMSANSPIWCEEDTGFASWRFVSYLTWPVSGWPPVFADGADYERSVEQLISSGVLLDSGAVTWSARLSERYPTLELRLADAQLSAADAVVHGLLVRALVERCLREDELGTAMPSMAPGIVDGALWLAARDGLSGALVDPADPEPRPALEVVDALVEAASAELERFGDLDLVEGHIDRLRREGDPASRQREAFERGGLDDLLALYRSHWDVPRLDVNPS